MFTKLPFGFQFLSQNHFLHLAVYSDFETQHAVEFITSIECRQLDMCPQWTYNSSLAVLARMLQRQQTHWAVNQSHVWPTPPVEIINRGSDVDIICVHVAYSIDTTATITLPLTVYLTIICYVGFAYHNIRYMRRCGNKLPLWRTSFERSYRLRWVADNKSNWSWVVDISYVWLRHDWEG